MPQYYDAHCHIFNKNIFLRQVVEIAVSLHELTKLAEKKKKLKLIKKTVKNIDLGLDTFMNNNISNVFDDLNNAYNGKFIITPLPIDLTYTDDNDGSTREDLRYVNQLKWFLIKILAIIGLIKGIKVNIKKLIKSLKNDLEHNEWLIDSNNYNDQIKNHLQLAKANPKVKPFLSLDPRRQRRDNKNLMDLVEKYFKEDPGYFVGIKLYAPVGFSPTDPILMGDDEHNQSIYKYCQEKKIPITIHNSNSGFSCFSKELRVTGLIRNDRGNLVACDNKKYKFKKKFFKVVGIGEAIEERARVLNHPSLWEKVLEKFPNLILNFGHFGGSSQIMERVNYSFPNNFKDLDTFDVTKMAKKVKDKAKRGKVWDLFMEIDGVYNIKSNLSKKDRKETWEILYKAGVIDNWSQAIFDIIIKYPNAYTDLSCFRAFDKKGDTSFINNLTKFKKNFFDPLDAKHKEKFLYGTDFFLILLSGIEPKNYVKTFDKVFNTDESKDFDLIASKNPEKFLGISNN
jgi:predicted TIM-barrel fold metal-dependent hydrolase